MALSHVSPSTTLHWAALGSTGSCACNTRCMDSVLHVPRFLREAERLAIPEQAPLGCSQLSNGGHTGFRVLTGRHRANRLLVTHHPSPTHKVGVTLSFGCYGELAKYQQQRMNHVAPEPVATAWWGLSYKADTPRKSRPAEPHRWLLSEKCVCSN